MSTPATAPRRARASKSTLPQLSTNGATPKAPSVAQVICPAAPRRNTAATAAHQTHGAITPLSGPVTNVSQIVNGGRNVAKGSSGSFTCLADYTAYLKTLALHELHNHAIKEARIVPIDDRERLIRRLEVQWTTVAARHPGRMGNPVPSRAPFSREQIAAQEEIRNKLLKT